MKPHHSRHLPVIAETSTPGVWHVYCLACADEQGDWIWPCDHGLCPPAPERLGAVDGLERAQLIDEVERLRRWETDYGDELRDKRNDLLNVRGILSPNGHPPITPVELVPHVAPAVAWLAKELRLRCEQLQGSREHVEELRAKTVTLSRELRELLDERDRLRQHSTWLNTVSWKVAQALGEVPQGAEEIEGDPVERAGRLVAEVNRLRADLTACRPFDTAAATRREGR